MRNNVNALAGEVSDVSARVIVMGVAGAGKTTIGERLAQLLNVPYADGDSFHSPKSVVKMARGEPLVDLDREPWLDAIGAWSGHHVQGSVASCSALKRTYRDQLRRWVPELFFVHLWADVSSITTRVAMRATHFMPASLVDSQFAELEELHSDEAGIRLNASLGADLVLQRAFEAVLRVHDA